MTTERELAALEAKVMRAGASGWLKSIDELRALLASESPDIKAKVLGLVAPSIDRAALSAVVEAFALGFTNALDTATEADQAIERELLAKRAGAVPASVLAKAKGHDAAARQALALAVKLARADADPRAILAPLFANATDTRAGISDALTIARNVAATQVADAADLPTVWMAETNACAECLAYSGEVAKPGEAFPGGLTYGRKSYNPNPVTEPPRHRNCRCEVEPLVSTEFADALKREADRSILRGFSLPSESMASRVDAADRLLDRGVDAPKSVKAYAKAAVKRGEFTTRGR